MEEWVNRGQNWKHAGAVKSAAGGRKGQRMCCTRTPSAQGPPGACAGHCLPAVALDRGAGGHITAPAPPAGSLLLALLLLLLLATLRGRLLAPLPGLLDECKAPGGRGRLLHLPILVHLRRQSRCRAGKHLRARRGNRALCALSLHSLMPCKLKHGGSCAGVVG